jgi:hypothetical protein
MLVGVMPGGGDGSLILASLTNFSSERGAEPHPVLHYRLSRATSTVPLYPVRSRGAVLPVLLSTLLDTLKVLRGRKQSGHTVSGRSLIVTNYSLLPIEAHQPFLSRMNMHWCNISLSSLLNASASSS